MVDIEMQEVVETLKNDRKMLSKQIRKLKSKPQTPEIEEEIAALEENLAAIIEFLDSGIGEEEFN